MSGCGDGKKRANCFVSCKKIHLRDQGFEAEGGCGKKGPVEIGFVDFPLADAECSKFMPAAQPPRDRRRQRAKGSTLNFGPLKSMPIHPTYWNMSRAGPT